VTPDRPFFSVIMPAHQAEHLLPDTLGALLASDLPRERWELIVVDDASSDETATVAGRYADTVVRIPGRPHGPAYARNRGFEVSRGDYIVFFDSDVRVHRDTLSRIAAHFDRPSPEYQAVFGSYDSRPAAPGLVSQYRNLLHHYVHHQNAGDVDTFWAGCGAVRRDVFEEAGMYDEWHFPRPQIEDVEMGHRIRALGHRVLLDPTIQVTHLKRWTFAGVVRTDLKDRGVPWARLLAHRGTMLRAGTLNLKWTEKLNVVLVWLALAGLPIALLLRSGTLAAASVALLLPVVLLSLPLHSFFFRERGLLFVLGVIPLHLLYYVLNGISVLLGVALQQTFGAPLPDPTIDAYSEIGIRRWPPVPNKQRRTSWNPSSVSNEGRP
jgi:glycosyltransferase involved in cell wall biosynthesis